MWTCPKCGRAFKRTNQGHYCGKAPETVDEYISSQYEKASKHLHILREAVLESCDNIVETIKWSMPTYSKDGSSVSFAACKNHISLYVAGTVMEEYRDELTGYEIKKNALYLPYSEVIPVETVKLLVKRSLGE